LSFVLQSEWFEWWSVRDFVSGLQPLGFVWVGTQACGLGCDVAAPLALNVSGFGIDSMRVGLDAS
jgi:hypothetical protein